MACGGQDSESWAGEDVLRCCRIPHRPQRCMHALAACIPCAACMLTAGPVQAGVACAEWLQACGEVRSPHAGECSGLKGAQEDAQQQKVTPGANCDEEHRADAPQRHDHR